MSDMKCPVCNCPMKQSTYDYETAEDPETWYCSYMPCDCVCSYGASKAVWEELIRTRKALEILLFTINRLENQNYKDCAWHLRLAIAKIEAMGIANKALEQITALEQKDK